MTSDSNSSSSLPENETLPSPLPVPPAPPPREEYRSEDDDVPVAPPTLEFAADCMAEEMAAVSECRDPSSLSPSLPICGFSWTTPEKVKLFYKYQMANTILRYCIIIHSEHTTG